MGRADGFSANYFDWQKPRTLRLDKCKGQVDRKWRVPIGWSEHSLGWVLQNHGQCILAFFRIHVHRIQSGEYVGNHLNLRFIGDEAPQYVRIGQRLLHFLCASQVIMNRWALDGRRFFNQIPGVPVTLRCVLGGLVARAVVHHGKLHAITIWKGKRYFCLIRLVCAQRPSPRIS